MGQKLFEDNVAPIVRGNATTVTMAATNAGLPTRITIGGQQYKAPSNGITLSTATAGFNGMDTGSFTAATIYNVFAVVSSGMLGMVLSVSTAPTGFTSYKFLGKLIAATGATISHVMNKGEDFVEYIYNTSTGDTNDITAFAYGAVGGLVPQTTLTSARQKRVRSLLALDNTVKRIAFQIDLDAVGIFMDMSYNFDGNSDNISFYQRQTGNFYGAGGWSKVVGSTTDINVEFGQYSTNTSTYAASGIAWSSTYNSNWRIIIIRGPITGP